MNLSLPACFFKNKLLGGTPIILGIFPNTHGEWAVPAFVFAAISWAALYQMWKRHKDKTKSLLTYEEKLANYEADILEMLAHHTPHLRYNSENILSIAFEYVLPGASDPQTFHMGSFIDYLWEHKELFTLAIIEEAYMNRRTESAVTASLRENGYLLVVTTPDHDGHTKFVSITRKKNYYGRT